MELIDSMPSDATSEKLHRHAYSIEQASIATSLSKSFLRARILNGSLQAKRFGRRVVILWEDLESFLNRETTVANK